MTDSVWQLPDLFARGSEIPLLALCVMNSSIPPQLHVGNVRSHIGCPPQGSYSARSASAGEIRLAFRAGITEGKNADNPNASTAVSKTKGLYGSNP